MRKPGADAAQFTPTATGWRLNEGTQPAVETATLQEAVKSLPPERSVEIALPCHVGILERLTLPSVDPEELAGMAQLHLEKTLPYPLEETTSAIEIIRTGETESTVLCVAVHTPMLEQICQPLRDAGRLPVLVSYFPIDVAAQCPSAPTVAAIWKEQENLVVAIYEEGHLSWAHTFNGSGVETLRDELPVLLIAAMVDGVPTEVEAVVIASNLPDLRAVAGELFDAPVGLFPIDQVRPRPQINLLPQAWMAETKRQERQERLKQRLMLAAVVYLLFIACAFLYLAWTKRSVQILDVQIARIQPAIQATQERQARWLALEPAINPHHYTVEVLYLVNRNRPDDVHITAFNCAPEEFTVAGEAPNAGLAIDFAERLRADKELQASAVDANPPKILPNEHAQFQIFGKL